MKNESKYQVSNIIFVLLLLLLFATSLFVISRYNDMRGILSNQSDYRMTTGEIISSRVVRDHSTGGVWWKFEIEYSYLVDAEVYSSNQVRFGFIGSSDKNFATEYARKYPIGASVIVFYDPLDPGIAVLEPESKDYWILIEFAVFIIVNLGLFIGWVIARKKEAS